MSVVLLMLALLWMKMYSPYYHLNDSEKKKVDSVLHNPETRYIGFYSLDMPSEFIPTAETGMFINGSDMTRLESKQQYLPLFKQLITQREAELQNEKCVDEQDRPYLKQVYPLPAGMNGVIFERMESVGVPDVARVLEAYKWEDSVTFKIEVKADDGRASKYDSNRLRSPDVYGYNIPEKKASLLGLLTALSSRKDTKSPTEDQFALTYGQIDEVLLGQYEFRVNYENPQGINFHLYTTNKASYIKDVLKEDSGVIEGEHGSALYKRSKEINNLQISEWLVKESLTENWQRYHSYTFTLTTQTDGKSDRRPLQLIMSYRTRGMSAGKQLNEAELVNIWQQIVSTLKYRKYQEQGRDANSVAMGGATG